MTNSVTNQPRYSPPIASPRGTIAIFITVLMAYVDESGNTGEISNGGSLTFTLGCVLLQAEDWPNVFNDLLAFRRRVRDRFGLPMRAEVRANDLIRNGGDFRQIGLAPAERYLVYRGHLRAASQLKMRAFGVVVDKRNGVQRDYFELAWEGLLQRLERTSSAEKQPFMVIHDEGEDDRIRKMVRKARRHLTAGSAIGAGQMSNPAKLLVDDPVARQSRQSYFVQLADLVAYAAFRSVVPPSRPVGQICPPSMWLELGAATHTAVNRLRRTGLPGVVIR